MQNVAPTGVVPPRPLNVKPDELPDGYMDTESNETEPYEVLKCNQRVMVFDGDAFTIQSPGYPEAAQENDT